MQKDMDVTHFKNDATKQSISLDTKLYTICRLVKRITHTVVTSQMDQILTESETKDNQRLKTIGKILTGVTGVCAFGICAIAVPFVTPALRKHCLPYVPATDAQVENIIAAVQSRSGRIVDLGSGDGRIVIELAKRKYESHGVELNPWLVAYSKASALLKGVSSNTRFFKKDLWKFSLSPYDHIVIFGVQQMMQDLETKIVAECKNDCNIVACRFPLPNLEPQTTIGHGIDTVWIYNLRR